MPGKGKARTVRWPATGRLLRVAAADVPVFEADGWALVEDGGAPADPEPEPSLAGAGDDGTGDAGASPPAKRPRRGRKTGG